ncbi:MAG: hypothetical protein EXX96DRAFT_72462 [Benjaminiella poitrasii]|nr:MAG: hypothetical protein EXX96DRAFT_72462 [Benjaminiella poitrasii]
MQNLLKILIFSTFIFNLIILTHQQQTDSLDDDDIDDDDDCAFISGQHCDENGICKYCAMCIQSSCILSKTVNNNGPNNNCNTTQFGTTNLYDWYDYCLSSGNDENGSKVKSHC